MTKSLFLFIIMLIGHNVLFAQANLDSLYAVWRDEKQTDSVRIRAFGGFIWDGYLFSQPDSALFYEDQRLDFARKQDNYWGIAGSLHTKGIAYHIKGDFEKALEANSESVKFRRKAGDKKGLASTLGNIGSIYSAQGDYSLALKTQKESLKIRKEIDDKNGIGKALNSIGAIYYKQGAYVKALDYYNRSLKIAQDMGNKKGLATALGNIGLIYEAQGDYSLALKTQEESLKIMKEIGDKYVIRIILSSIGIIYKQQGAHVKALDYYNRSLKIAQDMGNKKGIANCLNNIGVIYFNLGDHHEALRYYRLGLTIKEEIDDKWGTIGSLTNIAIEHKMLKAYDSSIIYNQRALKIANDIGDKYGTGNILYNMGDLYKGLKEYDKALSYFENSTQIMQEIGNQKTPMMSLLSIGKISFELKNYKNSISNCLAALSKAKDLGVIAQQKSACDCLYKSYKALGNGNKALIYHEKMLVLNDSLKSEETTKKLQQMEFAKQVMADSLLQVEKDLQVEIVHQVEVRKKDKNRNLAIGAGIFFLVLSGGFFSRWRYVKKSKAIIEKEKDRSENLLLNILPAEIAEELKEKGQAEARDFDLVSILFTDFKGFTQASEKLTAQELIGEINHCFKAFDHICEKYGIEKIKTIGDAYMAAGGLPVPTDTSVKNTVMAALEMQDFIVALKAEKEQANKIFFEMRVGVHTGPVVAGIVGVKKFQYDIWGDTVNTASRMESSGEIGKVNISEDTFKLLQNNPEMTFTERGKVQAKGKGQLKMYFVEKA